MAKFSPLLNVMQQVVLKAAKLIGRDFYELQKLQNSTNGPWQFTQRCFERTRQILCEELARSKGDFAISFDGSAYVYETNANYRFLVEPIDGYENLVRALPYFTIAVVAQKLEGEHYKNIASVIYSPVNYNLFYSHDGSGSWHEQASNRGENSERLRVSGIKELHNAHVTFTNLDDLENFKKIFAGANDILAKVRLISFTNCLSLSFMQIAEGKADIAISYKAKAPIINAAKQIITEAGGYFESQRGEISLASNNLLNKHLTIK